MTDNDWNFARKGQVLGSCACLNPGDGWKPCPFCWPRPGRWLGAWLRHCDGTTKSDRVYKGYCQVGTRMWRERRHLKMGNERRSEIDRKVMASRAFTCSPVHVFICSPVHQPPLPPFARPLTRSSAHVDWWKPAHATQVTGGVMCPPFWRHYTRHQTPPCHSDEPFRCEKGARRKSARAPGG